MLKLHTLASQVAYTDEENETMKIDGKAAVVTGASRGVGRATALMLAEGGCSVVVNYSRSKEEAEGVVEEVRALGVKAIPFQADVADDAGCRAMMDAAVNEFGSLQVLVNNAGTTQFIPHSQLDMVTDEVWDRILGVNLKGPFQCIRAARPHMEAAGEGEIVNVSSVAGVAGLGSCIPYAASKGGLNNLTITLARVMAPTVRLNTVAPGFIEGEWLKQGLGPAYEPAKKSSEGRAVLGKVCAPADVAAAILAFITGSDLVTGQVLVCDGGMLIGPKS